MNEFHIDPEDLKAYVDGELAPAKMAAIEEALPSNPALQKEVAFLREINRMLQTEIKTPEPEGKEKVLKALSDQEMPKAPAKAWWTTPNFVTWGSVAAVLLLVFGVSKMMPQSGADGFVGRAKSAAKKITRSVSPSSAAPLDGAAGKEQNSDLAPVQNGYVLRSSKPAEGDVSTQWLDGKSAASPRIAPSGNRQIARSADLSVKVRDAELAQNRAHEIINNHSGEIWNDHFERTPNPEPYNPNQPQPQSPVRIATATFEAEVPTDQLDATLHELSSLGSVQSQSESASDETSRLTDIKKELAAVKGRYQEDSDRLNTTPSGTKDYVRLQELRSQAREQERDLTAQLDSLKTRVARSHILLTLYQESTDNLGDTWYQAKKSLGDFAGTLGQFLIFVLVWSPVWIPVGFIAALISKRMNKAS